MTGVSAFDPVPCHRCGEDFPPRSTNGTDKYCPACRPIALRERKNAWQRAKKQQARPPLGELAHRNPLGPEEHKLAKRALGLDSVDDLLATDRGNDPFYQGGETHHRDAGWFKSLWDGASAIRAHLRRIHYWALSVRSRRPDGEQPHENTDACWTFLTKAAMRARVLGLLDPEDFDDRRNDPAVVNCPPRDRQPEPEASFADDWEGGLWLPRIRVPSMSLTFPEVAAYGYDYEKADLAALVEVWIEKSTMNDILEPLCRGLGVNLVAGSGHQSITAAIALLRRAQAHGRAAHVLYIADFDPGGDSMARSVARQAQFWAQRLKMDVEITVEVVALTREQVERYNLPPAPIKETDRRRASFEARHGVDGAVELDALEALHPGVLARLVREAAEPWIDRTLSGRLGEAEDQADTAVEEQWEDATTDLRAELESIEGEAQRIIGRYRQAASELDAELQPLRDRLNEVGQEASNRLSGMEFELPARPEPADPDVDRNRFLYDSRRGWLEQVAYWRRHKGGQA
jgi:ribosomal protein L37E